MTVTDPPPANGAGSAKGSPSDLDDFAHGDAESRALGRAANMAAFLKLVAESVDSSAEKPPGPEPLLNPESAKTDSAAIPTPTSTTLTRVAKRFDIPRPSPGTARREKLSDGFAYPPRGMNADQAAAYVGLGRTKFLEMVKSGQMPKSIDLDGSTRWDRVDLDHKLDDLKQTRDNPSTASRARISARLDAQERETDHETRIAIRPKR